MHYSHTNTWHMPNFAIQNAKLLVGDCWRPIHRQREEVRVVVEFCLDQSNGYPHNASSSSDDDAYLPRHQLSLFSLLLWLKIAQETSELSLVHHITHRMACRRLPSPFCSFAKSKSAQKQTQNQQNVRLILCTKLSTVHLQNY